MNRVSFILPAAGDGRRMNASLPKPFLPLGGIPVIIRSLNAIRQVRAVAEVVVVLSPSRFVELRETYGEMLFASGATALVPGGATRQDSVSLGLAALREESLLLAVHDAVRPFASVALMDKLCAAAAEHGAAVPVLPVTDTLKKCSADTRIIETVSRQNLYQVQTPQVFHREKFASALGKAEQSLAAFTDDASMLEAAGEAVIGIPGERFNLKITTPDDLRLAEALLNSKLM